MLNKGMTQYDKWMKLGVTEMENNIILGDKK